MGMGIKEHIFLLFGTFFSQYKPIPVPGQGKRGKTFVRNEWKNSAPA
jgi:hypothetical protein